MEMEISINNGYCDMHNEDLNVMLKDEITSDCSHRIFYTRFLT